MRGRAVDFDFFKDENAAIGPLYAVAILVLVAMAGIGFDYGRLMALDTELQNAADHAAIAAATQLDGGPDAMLRARNAATNALATASSSFVNETRFANRDDDGDGDSRPITQLTFEFFEGYENDAFLAEVPYSDTDGENAKVVQVTVDPREVFYALTPVVGAISSGDVIGRAAAMLETAVCNVPPMMFCVPNDANGNAITSFPTDADRGKGLHLHMNANAADPWAPGNFGFLDIDYLNTPSGNPNHKLGWNSDTLGCTGDPIESRTGVRDPEADALNSRFDFYSGSVGENSCSYPAGDNCPAASVRKNYTVTETITIRKAGDTLPPTPACGADSSTDPDIRSTSRSGWNENTAAENFPKDTCFDASTCNVIGDAIWDINGYFAARSGFMQGGYTAPASVPNGVGEFFANLGGKGNNGISSWADVLRYEVYLWEQDPANAATHLAPEMISSNVTGPDPVGASGDFDFTFQNVCAYPEPVMNPPGLPASVTQKDRRVMTVAAVDCTGLNGSDLVNILRWVDLFLVQPADINGADKSFFTEIIGPAKKADNTSGFQYFGRRKAVLIR